MKTIEEVRDYLLENRVDQYGDLDLIGLDFNGFDGDVLLNGMKVKRDLWQSKSTVQGNYICRGVEVCGTIFTKEPTKILKKVTREELAEMGYEVI